MTIWDLIQNRPDDDFTVYDETIDACVEVINICSEYQPNNDLYEDFIYELYRRITITDEPDDDSFYASADFYGFIEDNQSLFEKYFEIADEDDPAATMTDVLNYVCAGGVSDESFSEMAQDLRQLPVPEAC